MKQQPRFYDEIIVDHFCGGGGASTGIEFATGRIVDVAVNHDLAAIGMHELNHPFTIHHHKNVFEVDPITATMGRPVGLMWLSPDCTHFSRAKGGTPVKKQIRGLAWLALKWASAVRPRVIMLENVPEFLSWCPVKNGYPIKARSGETFKQFVSHLQNLGYAVEWRVLSACDYGAGTSRKRLYLVARCDGKPIVFPAPTHGEGLKPKVPASQFIDFSLRGNSIFNRKKPLAEATMKRIAKGLDKFTIKSKKPFIIQSQFNNQPQNAEKPLTTVCGVNKHFVVSPHISKYFSGEHQAGSAANEPLGTVTAIDHNALAMPYLVQIGQNGFAGDNRSSSIEQPIKTTCVKNEHCFLSPHLIQYHSETSDKNNRAYSLDEPLKVIDTNPRYGLSTANIIRYYKGDDHACDVKKPLGTVTVEPRFYLQENHLCVLRKNADCKSVDEPLPTLTTSEHFAHIRTYITRYEGTQNLHNWSQIRELLNAHAGYSIAENEILIIEIDGVSFFISDIEMRMLSPKELYGCQGFPPDYDFEHAKINGVVVKLSKAEQVKKVGNSVCPPVAKALVEANLPEYKLKNPINTMKELLNEVAA
ncbi:MAG: DNA cytosine methyltransferase [Firmicutes bacterium]|nr:DNA cytosine methyltransferase [Bacillota bacterium]